MNSVEASLSVLPSISPRERLADDIANLLREQIIKGDIPAGTQLLQIELAQRLGVSRTPLREAFRVLERDGLVRISNGNKTVEVAELGVEQLRDTFQVREVTDGLAARLAASREVPEELLERMRTADAAMERATTDGNLDIVAFSQAHMEWHLLLLEASGNSQLKDFGRLVRISSHNLIMRNLDDEGHKAFDKAREALRRQDKADHKRILDAIVKQRPEAAEESACKHVARFIKHAEDVIAWREKNAR
ncbi:GntR family transcriptional regulator [Rhodococcus sp. WAY2]|uniref:GntR family transcriptional regulator n=1 Tax=Rhodococcus sp. WAY2 TaxID=2663121 RepID=UPI00132049E0|nr:GntR family transcriptional regulator [Rhodococcus sp. WAY2]QHE73320.1 Transcriptional regulator, GntR family [Rhodococcus sp. WAY2]